MIDLPNIGLRELDLYADWVEAAVLASPEAAVSQMSVIDVLHDAGLFPSTEPDDYEEAEEVYTGSDASESFVEDIWLRLRERRQRLDPHHGFEVDGDVLRSRHDDWRESLSITALVLTAIAAWYPDASVVSQVDGISYRQLFEKIVQAATAGLFSGRSVRFGVPADPDWPTGIRDRVKHFGELMDLRVEDLEGKVQPTDGDRTLDVASRVEIGDESPATLLVLTQCATGKNWRIGKTDEPKISMWDNLVDWDGSLVRAVAVPFWIGESGQYRSDFRRFNKAMILDRPRLLKGEPDSNLDDASQPLIEEWCRQQLLSLPRLG